MTQTPVIRAHDYIDNKVSGQPLLYSQKGAAYMLSLSPRTIGYLISNQQLKTRKMGDRRLIPLSELQRFAKSDCPVIVKTPKRLVKA